MVSGSFQKLFLRGFFLCCILQTETASSFLFPPKEGNAQVTPSLSKHKEMAKVVLDKSSSLINQGLQDSDTLKKVFSINFEEIPTTLKSVNDIQLNYYIKVLMQERRKLQRIMIYHMTQCWAVAVGSYLFHEPFMSPFIKMILIDDDGRRKDIEELWAKHQQRMTDFVLEYLQVKNIPPNTLPRNAAGVAYVRVSTVSDNWEQLPVYVTQKGDPLPPFATEISTSSARIMKSWWSAPDDKPSN